MRILTLLLITCLLTLGGYYYYEKHFKPAPPAPVAPEVVVPPPFTLAENDMYTLVAPNQAVVEKGLPVLVTVTNKATGESFVLPEPINASLGGYVKNDTAKTTLFYSAGTSQIRTAHLIDLASKRESLYFCHVGMPIFWKTYFIYEDCITSDKLDIKAGMVENGEYMPVIYKIDLTTGEKTEVIKSDELHTYSVDRNRTYADTDTELILHMTSVAKLSDWADFTKWKEGEKVLKID